LTPSAIWFQDGWCSSLGDGGWEDARSCKVHRPSSKSATTIGPDEIEANMSILPCRTGWAPRGRRDHDRISLRELVGDTCQGAAYQEVLGVKANESNLGAGVGWCKSLTGDCSYNASAFACCWPCLAARQRYLAMNRGEVVMGLRDMMTRRWLRAVHVPTAAGRRPLLLR
jgi:hypothetical protein